VNAVLAECGLVALEDGPERGPRGVVHRSLTGSADARVGPRRGRPGRDVELELDHLLADRSERPSRIGRSASCWRAGARLARHDRRGAVENARENERELGEAFARSPLPEDPTPEQAWKYVNELWEGDPGGRGWQVRVPAGATWLALRDDEDDPARAGGPEPTFGFGEPPAAEGNWEAPGY
jgi:hypothetical protein